MLSMYYFKDLRAFIDAGLSNSEIARRLGIHRATVRKYRNTNTKPTYKVRDKPTRDNPLQEFEDIIAEWICARNELSATSIFLVLKAKGYKGSLRTVERRVEFLRSSRPKERFYEQIYEPGEQSQFDFKESIQIPFVGGPEICHLLIGTLPCSGFFFFKAFPNKTFEAFADGMHSFFEAAGGLTKNIRFDNLSPVVKKVLKGSERLYTKSFERVLNYYGFDPLPCAPRKGNEKGDCERDIRTYAHRILDLIYLNGKIFNSFDDLNEWLKDFAFTQQSDKTRQALQAEILHLKPLPPRDDDVLCQVHIATVGKHGTVRLSKTSYSVPDAMILREAKIVVSAYDVKIYQISPRKELIACHPRIAENTSSILLEHAIPSLTKKPHAMVRWAHRDILFPLPIFEKYYRYLQKIMAHGAEAEFLKSLNLIQHTQLLELAAGIELLLEAGSESPFFDLKNLVVNASYHSPSQVGDLVKDQSPLNIVLSNYDSLIPA